MVKYFGRDLPPISQLEKRATLALVNSSPILDHLGPMPDNVIQIGGMHVKETKQLPKVSITIPKHSEIISISQIIHLFKGFGDIS